MSQNINKELLIKDLNNSPMFNGIYFSLAKDGETIDMILPRDDTFLPPEVSNEYYDAVFCVMDFANCTKEEAIDALDKTDNDIVNAIKLFDPEFEWYDDKQ